METTPHTEGYCRTCVTVWALCKCCLATPATHYMAPACALSRGHEGLHDWQDPPRVTVKSCNEYSTTFRIEGGAIAAEWAANCARRGSQPWCEFTITDGGDWLGSYGGEVWPSAWPALFESTATPEWPRGGASRPAGLRLTAVGKVAIAVAKAVL